MFRNELKAVNKTDTELRVSNYMVLFGGKDLSGEFFTKSTKFDSPFTDSGVIHVDFEHGFDVDGVGNSPDNILGRIDWDTAKFDENGIFVERVLNRQAQYMESLEFLIEDGLMGTSSEAVGGKTARKATGEITHWPIKRDSLTLTPCEPRMVGENALKHIRELKSFFPNSKSLAMTSNVNIDWENVKTLRDCERVLRDEFGASNSVASRFMSHVKGIVPGEPVESQKQIKALQAQLRLLKTQSIYEKLKI